MANLTTKTQGVQGGGIGNQSIVSAPTPSFSSAVRSVGQDLNAIRSLTQDSVNKEAEDISMAAVKDLDTALGSLQEAEEERNAGPFKEEAIAALENPGREALGEEEFELLKKGVRNGKITQDQANLFTANQITKKIQERPVFAERIREAASRVVGFDPRSLQVRTVLDALGTEPTKAGGAKTFAEKKREEAEFQAAVLGTTVEEELGKISKGIEASRAAQTAQDDYNIGAISLEENLGKQVSNIGVRVLDSIQEQVRISTESGQPIDAVAIAGGIEAAKIQAANNLRAAAGNKATAPATLKAIQESNKIYDAWQSYADTVGVDNITQAKLERVKRFQDLYGAEAFGQYRVLKNQLGDRAVDRLMDLSIQYSDKPDLFAQRLKLFPKSKEMLDFMNGDTVAYTKAKFKVMDSMSKGIPLTPMQKQMMPEIIDEITRLPNGNRDGQAAESVIKSLGGNGDAMTSSMLAKVPVIEAGAAGKAELKRAYAEDRGSYINSASQWIAQDPDNNGFTFDGKGNLVLTREGLPSATQGAFDVQERVNIFNNALDRGWGSTLGTSKEKNIQDITNRLRQGIEAAKDSRVAGVLTQVSAKLQAGDEEGAKKLYSQAQKLAPEKIVVDFSQVKDELAATTQPFITTPELKVQEKQLPVGTGTVLDDGVIKDITSRAEKAGITGDRLKLVLDETLRRKKEAELGNVLTSGGLSDNLF
jgi:hypothetical protein